MALGMNSDSASDVAVRDGCSAIDITHDGTYLRLASDTGIAEGDILNICIRAEIGKETVLVVVIVVGIDAEAADGVAVAVEMALES